MPAALILPDMNTTAAMIGSNDVLGFKDIRISESTSSTVAMMQKAIFLAKLKGAVQESG